MQLNMRTKLIVYIVLLIVTAAAAALVPPLYFFFDRQEQEQQRAALQGVNGLNNIIEEYKKDAANYATIFSKIPDIAQSVETQDTEALMPLLVSLEKDSGLDFIAVTDASGVVLLRTHTLQKGDNIVQQVNVQSALDGVTNASLGPDPAIRLAIQAGAPLRNDRGNIVGVVLVGYDAAKDKIVNRVKKLFNTEATLFLGDERVSTTILKENQRAVGTKLNDVVLAKVLGEGQTYVGRAEILETEYMTAYLPVLGADGKPIGVLFAGESLTDFLEERNKYTMIFGFIMLCLLVVAVFTATKQLHTELEEAKNQLEKTVLSRNEELQKSYRFTELVVENIPDAIFVKDAKDLSCVRINKAAEELLGHSRTEIVGNANANLLLRDVGLFKEADVTLLRKGLWVNNPEEPFIIKGKGLRWLHTKMIPIVDAQGTPEYLLGITADVSELKETLGALEIAAKEKRLVLDSTSDIILYHDLAMRVVWANQKVCDLTKQTAEELRGKVCWEVWYQRNEPCAGCPVILALNSGEPQAAEMVGPDGRIRYIRGYPIENDRGQIIGAAEFCSDITDQKEAELKILQAREAIDRASQVVTLAVIGGGIAHEINQPLNAIRILVETVLYLIKNKENLPTDTIWQNIRNISCQVDRIDDIVNHLRSFLRSSQTFEYVPCNLNDAVQQALSIITNQLISRKIIVKKLLAAKLPSIYGSPVRFEEVVLNLLMNAIQALEVVQESHKEIMIRTWVDERVNLAITDNGTGIDQQIRDNIFEPFFSTKKNGESMGLGLSIVQSIVSASNGSIHVDNNPLGGVTIQVSFPIREN
ncbi:MAG TPA: cache domain-containing protein [Patescibacteria group bacterium]|nr:cache domain-containing protein [Patescibacteria group bacterium]